MYSKKGRNSLSVLDVNHCSLLAISTGLNLVPSQFTKNCFWRLDYCTRDNWN